MALRYSLHRPSPSLWGRLARESPPLSINLRLEPPGGFENQDFCADLEVEQSAPSFVGISAITAAPASAKASPAKATVAVRDQGIRMPASAEPIGKPAIFKEIET